MTEMHSCFSQVTQCPYPRGRTNALLVVLQSVACSYDIFILAAPAMEKMMKGTSAKHACHKNVHLTSFASTVNTYVKVIYHAVMESIY